MAMAREMRRTVQQSLLDRLIDNEPTMADDSHVSWSDSVRELRLAVRRDLEWLLNTRCTPQPPPASCRELRQSLYRFGLPDFSALHQESPDTAPRLAREVEEAVALFEPRLANARVSLAEVQEDGERRLHFVIEAMLRLDPNPERIVFDTVLDITRNEFEVQTGGSAAGKG